MDFSIPEETSRRLDRFRSFLDREMQPNLGAWIQVGSVPRDFYGALGRGGWFGFNRTGDRLEKGSALEACLLMEELAKRSPGVAVAILAHVDLGLTGLWLFGSESAAVRYGEAVVRGETLMCLGNTETGAGSDVANIAMEAEKVDGGWLLTGAKAYVTGGLIGDIAVVTAVSDPDEARSRRLSMFLVDLETEGVSRTRLNKQVWIPSDLTRVKLERVFVPEDLVMGERGRGLQQVLRIFTHSRVPISALTLGTAVGAFEMALEHGKKHKIFGKRILDYQAKAFEVSDFHARMEAARLMLYRACWMMDRGEDFRMESSLAKYLAVRISREVTLWAADLFGAASVMGDHPVHKFPMDVWGASLGEGTQDVHKLVIFRELMKRR